MYNNQQDIIDAVRAASDVLRGLLLNCTETEARTKHGRDEDWSVVQVLCHLRDVDERMLERMRMMRDLDEPRLTSYDENQWARERNYAETPLKDALAGFERNRAEYLRELEQLTPKEWERGGTHEEYGPITIINQAIHLVAHDTLHAAQIAEQLSNPGPGAAQSTK